MSIRRNLTAALILLISCAAADRVEGQGAIAPTHPDLAYGDHARQRLDLYLPAARQAPRPVIVWIHGGGWQSGDKFPVNSAVLTTMLNSGFAVASVNYRLSGDAIHPAQIHDCKGAIRWLRAHAAEYGLDPARFGSWGSSAGGHLSALVGVTCGSAVHEGGIGGNLEQSSCVQATADYFGPTHLCLMGGAHNDCQSPESRLIGACLGEVCANLGNPAYAAPAARVFQAGVVFHVTPDDPPFHIAHGTADGTVPPAQSQLLHDTLVAAGVTSTLRLVPGAGHGLPPSEANFVRDFFLLHLAEPFDPDIDGDGDADLTDYAILAGCLRGPGVAPGGACAAVDLDRDSDVDLHDATLFARSMAGVGG